MALLSLPRTELKRIIARRRAMGGDRYDEVWDGVYVMSPLADLEHQDLGRRLANAIEASLDLPRARVFHGCNVSDQPVHWRRNYRCPDVAVFLPDNPARPCKAHWFGGPDLAVEILSRGDRSRKKFGFYASVNVRALLLVNRRPWELELHARSDGDWHLVGKSTADDARVLPCDRLGLSFRLQSDANPRRIEIVRIADQRVWLV